MLSFKGFTKYKLSLYYIFSICALLSLNPYFLWNNGTSYKIALVLLLLIYLLGITTNKLKVRIQNVWIGILTIFLFIYIFIPNKSGELGLIQFTYIYHIIVIILFILINKEDKINIYKTFKYMYIVTLIPAIIVHLLLFSGVTINLDVLPRQHYLGSMDNGYYLKTIGTVIYAAGDFSIKNLRLCAMYSEPGLVGTVSAFIIAIDGLDFKKKINVINIIAGILSFSLAFYVLCFIKIILNHVLIKKVNKRYSLVVVVLMALITLSNYEIVKGLVFNRFIIQNNSIAGNNRESIGFKIAFDNFLSSTYSNLLFGNGFNAHKELLTDVSSWRIIIYDRGILGLILIACIFVVMVVKYKNIRTRIFLFIFFISIYQRPLIYDVYFIVLLLGGVEKITTDFNHIRKEYVDYE